MTLDRRRSELEARSSAPPRFTQQTTMTPNLLNLTHTTTASQTPDPEDRDAGGTRPYQMQRAAHGVAEGWGSGNQHRIESRRGSNCA
jgi:hypothetical protein